MQDYGFAVEGLWEDVSGSISKAEVADVLKELDPAWNEESLKRLMANADANADGKLQTQEFVNWIFSGKGSAYSTEAKAKMIDEVMAELQG